MDGNNIKNKAGSQNFSPLGHLKPSKLAYVLDWI